MAVALGLTLQRVQLGDTPRYDLADGALAPRRDRLLVLMGGGEAERIIFGEPVGTGTDDEQIADLLTADDNEIALREQVRRLFGLNAGTLRYLAAKLARCGKLSGDQVEQLVRGRSFPRWRKEGALQPNGVFSNRGPVPTCARSKCLNQECCRLWVCDRLTRCKD
ncbi:MAG TPA: hypothetical protein VH439_06210 [Gemmatimonadales bacterium]